MMTLREQVEELLPSWKSWYPSLFDAAADPQAAVVTAQRLGEAWMTAFIACLPCPA